MKISGMGLSMSTNVAVTKAAYFFFFSMVERVENAAVVCCFMTPDYQKSSSCQHELEYAHKNKIHIIPCMLGDKHDREWKPSNWLDLLTSGIDYVNFTDDSESSILLTVKDIIKRINNPSPSCRAASSSRPDKLFKSIREKYLTQNSIRYLMNEKKIFPIEQNYITFGSSGSKRTARESKLNRRKQYNYGALSMY